MNSIQELPEHEFAQKILVLINRNSLGHILASLRGITVGWSSDHQSVHLIAYFEREPTETDHESIREIAAEIEAAVGFSLSQNRFLLNIKTEARHSQQPIEHLQALTCWVYFRDEGTEIHYTIPEVVRQALESDTLDTDRVLVATQQSLIGRISASTRQISVGWDEATLTIHLRAYTDTPDNDRQQDLLEAAAHDLAAVLKFSSATAECLFSDASYADLDHLTIVPFLRYEAEMGYFEPSV